MPQGGKRLTTLAAIVTLAAGLALGGVQPAVAATPAHEVMKLELVSSHTPTVGTWQVFGGTTSASLAGARFELQRRQKGHGWITLAASHVRKNSSFGVRVRTSGLGVYTYRAVASRGTGRLPLASDAVSARVSQYFYLRTLKPLEMYSNQSTIITMAGKTYSHSVVLYTADNFSQSLSVNVSYKCTSFESTVGVDDSSNDAFTSRATMSLDGAALGTYDLKLGQIQSVKQNITGGFRLAVTAVNTGETSSGSNVGWGDARVLCSAKPVQ